MRRITVFLVLICAALTSVAIACPTPMQAKHFDCAVYDLREATRAVYPVDTAKDFYVQQELQDLITSAALAADSDDAEAAFRPLSNYRKLLVALRGTAVERQMLPRLAVVWGQIEGVAAASRARCAGRDESECHAEEWEKRWRR